MFSRDSSSSFLAHNYNQNPMDSDPDDPFVSSIHQKRDSLISNSLIHNVHSLGSMMHAATGFGHAGSTSSSSAAVVGGNATSTAAAFNLDSIIASSPSIGPTKHSNQFYYNTIHSQKSFASFDSHQNHLNQFQNGQIEFLDGQQRLRRSFYVKVHVDDDIEEVAKFVFLKWLKRTPKIIIPVITGLSHFKTWKNQKQLNKFKRGIIKAAYTTELMYITNGYNMGISKLIGDAFREESLARRTTTTDFNSSKTMNHAGRYLHSHQTSKINAASFFNNNNNKDDSSREAEELDKLVLIGIVSTSDLKYSELFDANAAKKGVITYKIDDQDVNPANNANANESKPDNYLNPDHTHFILVDDDNSDLKLIKFRVALEKRLQKPIMHKRSKRPTAQHFDLNAVPSPLSAGSQAAASQDPMVMMMKPSLLDRSNANNDTSASLPTTTTNVGTASSGNGVDDSVGSAAGNMGTYAATIPIVGLLIGGGIGSISLVLSKIYQGIPILIFKGTGHAPDLISGICEDFADRHDNLSDNHLRTAITMRISEKFPKESKDDSTRNKIKDNLLQIIKYSNTQENGNLLTFIDATSSNSDLHELDKYILVSLIQSQPANGQLQSKDILKRNLMLILDWNHPEIALSEIFQREGSYKLDVDKAMFEKALLKKNREEFIEIFLDQGFQIHRFLNHIKMFLLFDKCEDREFFLTVCVEKGLGVKLTPEDFDVMRPHPPDFFQKYLNPLVKKLSDIEDFFQVLEMSLNALKLYIEGGEINAERKALVYLIVFAVLLKRHKLAKILWKRTDQPISVALLCSMIYKRLSLLCHESYIKSELDEYSKDFARYAIGVLDLSFSQSDCRVYDVLNRKNHDLNDLTVIELAYNSDNKDFLAHPCCQKWITKKFYGEIEVRELNFGLFKLPTWIKILSSAFLVFPMYLWIVFPVKRKKIYSNNSLEDETNAYDSDRDDQDDQDEEKMIRNELINISTKSENRKSKDKRNNPEFTQVTPTFIEKTILLWTAPITKFWINLLSYIIYLCIFGLAVLWPSCGNLVIDAIVWFWTALICCETARRTYNKYVMGSNLPIKFSCFEIIIMLIFLILYLFIRILRTWSFDIHTSKTILCLGLIYFYYRSVFVYLPISPTLGPMLVKMKYMVRIDFLTFLRMFIVFMAAGGITINAIIYPYYPLNSELVKRVFLRAFFGLFVTEKEDLNGRDYCDPFVHENKENTEFCSNIKERFAFNPNGTAFNENNKIRFKHNCPYPSAIGWAILIQYLLLVKLFLTTLLTAMFSHTKAKVDAESDQIWMFQRYEIVIDYETRLRLPPPLTVISYFIMIIDWLARSVKRFTFKKDRMRKPSCVASNMDSEKAAAAAANMRSMPDVDGPDGHHHEGATPQGESKNQESTVETNSSSQHAHTNSIGKLFKFGLYQNIVNRRKSLMFSLNSTAGESEELRDKPSSGHANPSLLCSEPPASSGLANNCGAASSTLLSGGNPQQQQSSSRRQIDHSNYWKIVVQDFAKKLDDSAREKDFHKEQAVGLHRLREEFHVQRKNIKRLDDHMVYVERNLTSIQVTVEYLKHFLTNKESTGLKAVANNNLQHIMARQSPYPFTQLSRFPVFDKYVSWEVVYDSYDPPNIIVDKETYFSKHELPFIDPDDLNLVELGDSVIELKLQTSLVSSTKPDQDEKDKEAAEQEQQASKLKLMDTEISLLNIVDVDGQLKGLEDLKDCNYSSSTYIEKQAKIVEKWNNKTSCIIHGQRVAVDRISWIAKNGVNIQYSSDTIGFPMNPMGRTGARGRGALWRWGPNHEIRVIVTRWRKHRDNPKNVSSKYMYVEGRRMMEFLAYKDPLLNGEWKLPGGKILGHISRYYIVCTCFSELIFEKPLDEQLAKEEYKTRMTENDMKNFFVKFATNSATSGESAGETTAPTRPVFTQQASSSSLLSSAGATSTHHLASVSSNASITEAQNSKFMAKRIYKGYIDDPRNTDNAWVEAEIWNFHYGDQDQLDASIPQASSKWKEVSSHVRLFANQSAILKEIASIHQAYF